MLFHIQYEGPAGWEPVGSGEAEEEDADGMRRAIGDLASLAERLEPGRCCANPAKGSSTRWLAFGIDAGGSVFDDEEPIAPGGRE